MEYRCVRRKGFCQSGSRSRALRCPLERGGFRFCRKILYILSVAELVIWETDPSRDEAVRCLLVEYRQIKCTLFDLCPHRKAAEGFKCHAPRRLCRRRCTTRRNALATEKYHPSIIRSRGYIVQGNIRPLSCAKPVRHRQASCPLQLELYRSRL